MQKPHRAGFTLIELLVVVLIIGLLVSLLMPAVQKARDAARTTECANKLKQMGLATHNFENAYRMLPKSEYSPFYGSPVNCGWMVRLLPYLEQQRIYDMYRFDLGPMKVEQQPAISQRIPEFECPSSPSGHMINGVVNGSTTFPDYKMGISDYINIIVAWGPMLTSPNTYPMGAIHARENDFALNVQPGFELIVDGTANTILYTEQAGRPQWWVKGKLEADVNPFKGKSEGGWGTISRSIWMFTYAADGMTGGNNKPTPWACNINCNNSQGIYSFHPAGTNVVMCDGSTKFLDEKMDPWVLSALISRARSEVIDADDY